MAALPICVAEIKTLIHSRTLTYNQKIRIKSSGRPVPIFKFDNAGMKDPILYILLINVCVVFKKRSKGGPKEGRGGFRAKGTEALYSR